MSVIPASVTETGIMSFRKARQVYAVRPTLKIRMKKRSAQENLVGHVSHQDTHHAHSAWLLGQL